MISLCEQCWLIEEEIANDTAAKSATMLVSAVEE